MQSQRDACREFDRAYYRRGSASNSVERAFCGQRMTLSAKCKAATELSGTLASILSATEPASVRLRPSWYSRMPGRSHARHGLRAQLQLWGPQCRPGPRSRSSSRPRSHLLRPPRDRRGSASKAPIKAQSASPLSQCRRRRVAFVPTAPRETRASSVRVRP